MYTFPGERPSPFPTYRAKPRKPVVKPKRRLLDALKPPSDPKVLREQIAIVDRVIKEVIREEKREKGRPFDPFHAEAFAAFLGRTHQALPPDATPAQVEAWTKARDRWQNRRWTWKLRRDSQGGSQ